MLKKISILSILLVTGCLLLATSVSATTVSDFTNHGAPAAYFYPLEFDKLVLDVTIPSSESGKEDTLNALTVSNLGMAKDFYDISKVVFWADAGKTGFQGMGIDTELGTAAWYDLSSYWYLSGLSQKVPVAGLRIFVSVETIRTPTTNRGIQMQIPVLLDNDGDKAFDLGDRGVFMASGKNGPTDNNIQNASSQTIKTVTADALAPHTVITDPLDGAKITTTSYTIKGKNRDQGGSTAEWVKISITKSGEADNWQLVTPISSNYGTWEYSWTGIVDGAYTIKTQSRDWLGNTESVGTGVTVTVDTTPPPAVETPAPAPAPAEQPAAAKKFQAGDLIKASGASVYYYGADGKRYVFPNDKVFKTWYNDFSSVKTITDAELADIMLGGNVTYRPSVKMVKITTDLKTYVVDKNGALRWVKTEAVARELYGDNWNAMVDDIADAFFVNYKVGAAIEAASDYNLVSVKAASPDIGTDKGLQ